MADLHLDLLSWIWTWEPTHSERWTRLSEPMEVKSLCSAPTRPRRRQVREPKRIISTHTWRTLSTSLFPVSPLDDRVSYSSPLLIKPSQEECGWEWAEEPQIPTVLLPGEDWKSLLLYRSATAELQVISSWPYAFMPSTRLVLSPQMPLSFISTSQGLNSNAVSFRKSSQICLHSSPMVVNNLSQLPLSQDLPCPALSTKDGPVTPVPTQSLAQGWCSWTFIESTQRISCWVVQGQVLCCVTLGQTCPPPVMKTASLLPFQFPQWDWSSIFAISIFAVTILTASIFMQIFLLHNW